MSPQFVDFDGDGHLDIVAGIFDGSVKVALGDGTHWRQPQWVLDKEGQRIVLNNYWDFDAKQWRNTERCDPDGGAPAKGHLTSAFAFDWDHDGDFDLLLGDHSGGYVYLRENEGSNAAPAFATRNRLVTADGEPMLVPGTVATLRALDWTGDGRLDLLVGSMGDPHGQQQGGGVFVYADTATGKGTRFGPAVTLIEPSPKGAREVTRPDAGLHMDAVDHDGDGDLDLIVGGYAMWTPPGPTLDQAQRDELEQLQAEQKQLTDRFAKLNVEMLKAQQGLDREAALKKRLELAATPERKAINERRAAVTKRIGELQPGQQRQSFVWLYENRRGSL